MAIEINPTTIFYGTHGSNWLQRQRLPIPLGEASDSTNPTTVAITVTNGLALQNWHVTVSSQAPTIGPQSGIDTLSQMMVAGGGSIHGTSQIVYVFSSATPGATHTIPWGNLAVGASARDPRVDIQSNPLGTLVDGVTYTAELTWTLIQGAP